MSIGTKTAGPRTRQPENAVSNDSVLATPQPNCDLCGAPGNVRYEGLRDRLFDAPGEWSFRKCSNPDCELLWLDPMPLPEELWKLYTSYYTHTKKRSFPGSGVLRFLRDCFLSSQLGYEHVRRLPKWLNELVVLPMRIPSIWEVLAVSVGRLPYVPGGRLLEVGCGNGESLANMKRLGWDVVGIDPDPKAVEQARRRGLEVHCGTLCDVDLGDDRFDAILMNHVFEHVPRPSVTLQRAHELLADDGSLSIVVPNPSSTLNAVFEEAWYCLDPPRHLHLWPRRTLVRLCESLGFEVLSSGTTARNSHVIHLKSSVISRTGRFTWKKPVPIRAVLRSCGHYLRAFGSGVQGDELVVVVRRRP